MIIPFTVKVNNVSSGGEVNFGMNVLMQQDSIQKNNTSSNNYGDASRFFVLSPMNDPDAIDSQINQVKRLP